LAAPVSITVLVIATRLATVQYGAADLAYNCYSAGLGLKAPATANSAAVTWTKSSGAVGYAIGLYTAGALYNNTLGFVKRPPTTSITFKNLLPSTFYRVFVWGFNASGGSPAPAFTSFTTAP
jgi:hypothetical protein